jgi:hypothetical protein
MEDSLQLAAGNLNYDRPVTATGASMGRVDKIVIKMLIFWYNPPYVVVASLRYLTP